MEGTTNIFQTTFCPQLPSDNNTTNNTSTDQFIVEDLLNLSNDDAIISDINLDSTAGNSTASSSVTVVNSSNSSSFSGCDPNLVPDIGCHFSGDLCVPDDDLAELEWLSNFVEESFSSADLQKMQMISGMKVQNKDEEVREFSQSNTNNPILIKEIPPSCRTLDYQSPLLLETTELTSKNKEISIPDKARQFSQSNRNNPIFNKEVSIPAKARSKRPRGPPCDWSSRLSVLSQATSSSFEPEFLIPTPTLPYVTPPKKQPKTTSRRKDHSDGGSSEDGRRCLHCATDKTPQWRTGPDGPKTLCNACGVRYKSGRLVPEYRPAASPTFVLTKHSNSHRKVLELRRQKEMMLAHQHQHNQVLQHHNTMFDMYNSDDYWIHQHMEPDFR